MGRGILHDTHRTADCCFRRFACIRALTHSSVSAIAPCHGFVACFAATCPVVAVGSVDGSIAVYDIPSTAVFKLSSNDKLFRLNRLISCHKGAVRDVAMHPQARYLVSCGRDGVIAFHDITKSSSQGPYRTIQVPTHCGTATLEVVDPRPHPPFSLTMQLNLQTYLAYRLSLILPWAVNAPGSSNNGE